MPKVRGVPAGAWRDYRREGMVLLEYTGEAVDLAKAQDLLLHARRFSRWCETFLV